MPRCCDTGISRELPMMLQLSDVLATTELAAYSTGTYTMISASRCSLAYSFVLLEEECQPQPRLDLLPTEILHRICQFSLTAELTVDEWPKLGRRVWPDFAFSVALLRVNKRIHNVARAVFEDNNFILISSPGDLVKHEAVKRGLWLRDDRAKIVKYKKYHLRIHCAPKKYISGSNTSLSASPQWFCIIPGLSLTSFCSVLSALEMSNGATFKIIIDFKADLLLVKQDHLMRSFRKLQETEDCQITGKVEPFLAARYTSLLTSTIHWTRARCWNFWERAYEMKDFADFMWAGGNSEAAYLGYGHFFTWLTKTHAFQREISAMEDDQNLMHSWWVMYGIACMSQLATGLHWLANNADATSRTETLQELRSLSSRRTIPTGYLNKHEVALIQYLDGLIAFAVADDTQAKRNISEGHQSHIGSECTNTELAFTTAFNDWYLDPKDVDRAAQLKYLLSLNGHLKDPHRSSPLEKQCVIRSLDMEQYILAGLGYTGPCLHDRLAQKEDCCIEPTPDGGIRCLPNAFDKAIADRIIAYNKEKHETYQRSIRGCRKVHLRMDPLIWNLESMPSFLTGPTISSHPHITVTFHPELERIWLAPGA